MKQRIILVSGISASGKTGLAKYLASKLNNTVRVDIDGIKQLVYKKTNNLEGMDRNEAKKLIVLYAMAEMKDLINLGSDAIADYFWSSRDGAYLQMLIDDVRSAREVEVININMICDADVAYRRYVKRTEENNKAVSIKKFSEFVESMPLGYDKAAIGNTEIDKVIHVDTNRDRTEAERIELYEHIRNIIELNMNGRHNDEKNKNNKFGVCVHKFNRGKQLQ